MAAAPVTVKKFALGNTGTLHIVTLTVTGTYTTGGESVDVADNERIYGMFPLGGQVGYVADWDVTNQKLKLRQDNGTATAAALPEVTNGANHTAISGSIWGIIGD